MASILKYFAEPVDRYSNKDLYPLNQKLMYKSKFHTDISFIALKLVRKFAKHYIVYYQYSSNCSNPFDYTVHKTRGYYINTWIDQILFKATLDKISNNSDMIRLDGTRNGSYFINNSYSNGLYKIYNMYNMIDKWCRYE